jgi:hypothetical protein
MANEILTASFENSPQAEIAQISQELRPFLSNLPKEGAKGPSVELFHILVGSAGALVCVERVISAYLSRNKGKKVHLALPDGSRFTIVGYSPGDLEGVLVKLKGLVKQNMQHHSD